MAREHLPTTLSPGSSQHHHPCSCSCSGSSYTSGECVSKLFLVTTSAWQSAKWKSSASLSQRKDEEEDKEWGREGGEEGYIASRVSLRWFRPVPAPVPFSSIASPPPPSFYSLHLVVSSVFSSYPILVEFPSSPSLLPLLSLFFPPFFCGSILLFLQFSLLPFLLFCLCRCLATDWTHTSILRNKIRLCEYHNHSSSWWRFKCTKASSFCSRQTIMRRSKVTECWRLKMECETGEERTERKWWNVCALEKE